MVEFKEKYEGAKKKKVTVKKEKKGIKREPQDDQPTIEQVIKKAK